MILQIPHFLIQLGKENFLYILGIIIPAWAILMIILERIYPYTKGLKLFRRGFWMDLVWYTILQSKVMEIVIFFWIILPLKSYLGLENFGPLSSMNFWLVLFFFFITHDFYIYWFHRLQHNHRWLWRTHEAHHSVREVDFLAGSRSHFLEILINQTVEFLPIFFLLNAETAAYIFPLKGLIDALWGMWIHSNINVNSGKLQYIINGPEMHQWHHANHHEVFYKNYGTKLAIWDWMFGTGFLPNLKPLNFYFSKPKTFGLPYAYPSGFFGQTVYALWRYDFRALESNPIYNFILNFRKNISSTILELFKIKSNWTREEIFAENNPRYLIDNQNPICPKCGQLEKYYEKSNDFIYTCEHCETHDELNKFN